MGLRGPGDCGSCGEIKWLWGKRGLLGTDGTVGKEGTVGRGGTTGAVTNSEERECHDI